MRKFRLVLCALIVLLASTGVASERLDVVKEGRIDKGVQEGKPWGNQGGCVVGAEKGNYLYATRFLDAGDFHIRAHLSIDKVEKTAAGVVLGGDFFGFDGGSGQGFFVEGKSFSGVRSLDGKIESGKPFVFEVIRKSGEVQFLVDGEKALVTKAMGDGYVGKVGLRPWRATMRVLAFSVEGNLTDVDGSRPDGTVFAKGDNGYNTFRIPAIIHTKKGTLLAFAEGRVKSSSDTGDIDIVLRRSEDGGKTWGDLIVVWDDGGNTCGNPCPVVITETGRILLPTTWNLGTDHESLIHTHESKDTRRAFLLYSDDDGKTWSKPREITDSVKKPDWGWYATGPGVGIQLTRGEHKGRIVIPSNHSYTVPQTDDGKLTRGVGSQVFYSDDQGETWTLSEPIRPGCNEAQVVERTDGSLMMNMRSYNDQQCRATAVSRDGGATWSPIAHARTLIESRCQGSFLRYGFPEKGEKSRVLFSNPATTSGRHHMTVRVSYDEGETWPVSRLLYEGSAAYSCLTVFPNGDIGCFFEVDGYGAIVLKRFTLDWLEGAE